jgi:hypothetical protein
MARSVSYSVLQQVLAQANKEQNQHYAPHIFETHFQLASDWLKDSLIKLYPESQTFIDLLSPYMDVYLVKVVAGKVPRPKEYRNFLGLGFYVTDKESCKLVSLAFKDPENPTDAELQEQIANVQSESYPVDMTTIGKWNYYSTHPFKKPKLKNAKACMFDAKSIKILPVSIPYVEIRLIKKTAPYVFGYQPMPDETYVFDPDATVEELWTENAIPYLFKAVNLLFANYVRDTEYIASAHDLRDNDLF